jgi:hypothetical protein
LRKIFAAAAASPKFCQRFFQELTHVMGLAGRLRENQRGLRRLGR